MVASSQPENHCITGWSKLSEQTLLWCSPDVTFFQYDLGLVTGMQTNMSNLGVLLQNLFLFSLFLPLSRQEGKKRNSFNILHRKSSLHFHFWVKFGNLKDIFWRTWLMSWIKTLHFYSISFVCNDSPWGWPVLASQMVNLEVWREVSRRELKRSSYWQVWCDRMFRMAWNIAQVVRSILLAQSVFLIPVISLQVEDAFTGAGVSQ